MAVTVASLTSGESSTDSTGAAYESASVTFPANTVALYAVKSRHGTNAPIPTGVTTTGLTWTAVTNGSIQTANGVARVTLFGAVVGNTAVTGTALPAFATTQLCGQWWAGYLSSNGAATVATALTSRLAATRVTSTTWNALDAVTAFGDSVNSGTLGIFGISVATVEIVQPTGWTELIDVASATPASELEVSWLATPDTTPDFTYTTSGTYLALVFELNANVNRLTPGGGANGGGSGFMIRRRRRRKGSS